MSGREPQFWMGGILAQGLQEITDDASRLDDGSFWAVLITFEGEQRFARFENVRRANFPSVEWEKLRGPWVSSIDRTSYLKNLSHIKEEIAAGGVYQVNACRVLTHSLSRPEEPLDGLFTDLLRNNPAAFATFLRLEGIEVASASPERFLSRSGSKIITSPIKGTILESEDFFGEKDQSENLMIVDLMRNDLGRICLPGSVEVSELFRHEKHPGITHLVSDVVGELLPNLTWREIFDATTPPGSVSGAPKSAAVRLIEELEGARGPYCGVLGWIHGDQAELAVAIRTFWKREDSFINFGTGAGITWGSDPSAEWEETQLKARKLISIAGGELGND